MNFKSKTLESYLDQLARKEPVPGGGSAAAQTKSARPGCAERSAQRGVEAGLGSTVQPMRLRRRDEPPSTPACGLRSGCTG